MILFEQFGESRLLYHFHCYERSFDEILFVVINVLSARANFHFYQKLSFAKQIYTILFLSVICRNHNNVMTGIAGIAVLGNYGKLVAPGVPADLLAPHLADGGQLPGCHSEHLHLGTHAGQQLSIGGEVDVVFC